jgi:luciferase family oxidoreductase group 1
MFPVSILDLVPVARGATAGIALANALDLARHAERLGFTRYWVAEHHNMVGIASAATSVVIGHLAGGTHTIRVGAGGIMLPNHSPLVIAEQFGTLESLYPGRIDLGLGRAPGTDHETLYAMRRDLHAAERFPEDVMELRELLGPLQPDQRVRAVPGFGTEVPLWILGSSLYGAQVAAHFGLPYAFASHFAPAALDQALAVYRERFRPSAQLAEPYAVAAVNVVASDNDTEARRLFTSHQQRVTDMLRNARSTLPPPIDDIDQYWSPAERVQAMRMLECSIVGSPETVARGLSAFIARTGADEVIATGMIFDHAARVHSFEILADAAKRVRSSGSAHQASETTSPARALAA